MAPYLTFVSRIFHVRRILSGVLKYFDPTVFIFKYRTCIREYELSRSYLNVSPRYHFGFNNRTVIIDTLVFQ